MVKLKFNLFERPVIKKNVTVGLTPLGASKAEQMYGMEGARAQILFALKDNGPSSVSELAEETKMSYHKVRSLVKEMMTSDAPYIRKAGAGAEE